MIQPIYPRKNSFSPALPLQIGASMFLLKNCLHASETPLLRHVSKRANTPLAMPQPYPCAFYTTCRDQTGKFGISPFHCEHLCLCQRSIPEIPVGSHQFIPERSGDILSPRRRKQRSIYCRVTEPAAYFVLQSPTGMASGGGCCAGNWGERSCVPIASVLYV